MLPLKTEAIVHHHKYVFILLTYKIGLFIHMKLGSCRFNQIEAKILATDPSGYLLWYRL